MQGVPDRVPVVVQMHEFAMNEIGAKANQFYTTPELLVTTTLEIQEKYGLDIPFLDYDVYNIQAEGIGQEIIYSEYSMPDVNRNKPLIRDQDDLKKIKTQDFHSAGRFALYLCNLGATMPAENVKAVFETVLTHGVY